MSISYQIYKYYKDQKEKESKKIIIYSTLTNKN